MMISRTAFAFLLCVFLASYVLGDDENKDEAVDPKKSLEGLGNFFKMISSTDDKPCATISCPQSSGPSQRPGHVPSSNGCGSLGIKLDTSTFPGFELCCDTHDKCYDTCNEARDDCDTAFKACLDKVCDDIKKVRSSDQVKMCENLGGIMNAAAVGLGCSAYTQAQKNACVCNSQAIGDGNSNNDSSGEKEDL